MSAVADHGTQCICALDAFLIKQYHLFFQNTHPLLLRKYLSIIDVLCIYGTFVVDSIVSR